MVFTENNHSRFKTDMEYRRKRLDSNNKYRKTRYNNDENYKKLVKKRTKEWREKIKVDVFNHYTKGTMKCQCKKCNIKGVNFLTIDHINGGGTKHRQNMKESTLAYWVKKNNYPDNITILCWNCNCSKGQFGYCH